MECDEQSLVNKCSHIQLIAAIEQGHVEEIKHLLGSGIDINDSSSNIGIPLHVAIRKGHLEICRILIEKGASVNNTNNMSETPLHISTRNGHCEISNLLLSSGADVNASRILGETPLIIAVSRYQTDMVTFLLGSGADVNKCNDMGQSPLHITIANNFSQVFDALLEHGADLNIKESVDYYTPLFTAIKYNRVEMVRTMLRLDISIANQQNSWGDPPLQLAIREKKLDMAMLLVQSGADVTGNDNENKESALFPAIVYIGFKDIKVLLRLMLEKGASINKPNVNGDTPLVLSIKTQDIQHELVTFLLENGADVNRDGELGAVPLYQAFEQYAKYRQDKKLTHILLENGAHINQSRPSGDTPLIYAVRLSLVETAEQLINHGADVNPKCWLGITPLTEALSAEPFINIRMVQMLLKQGADANQAHAHRIHPLHQVLMKRVHNPALVGILLEHGADANALDANGDVPLSKTACPQTIEALLEHGADVETADKDGVLLLVRTCAPMHPDSEMGLAYVRIQLDAVRVMLEHNEKGVWSYSGD